MEEDSNERIISGEPDIDEIPQEISLRPKDLDEYGSWVYDREDMLRLKIILENWIERHEMAIDRVIQIQTIPEGGGEIQISNVIYNMIILTRNIQARSEN